MKRRKIRWTDTHIGMDIVSVAAGSSAATMGLEPGDFVIEVDGLGLPVSLDELRDSIRRIRPGSEFYVSVVTKKEGLVTKRTGRMLTVGCDGNETGVSHLGVRFGDERRRRAKMIEGPFEDWPWISEFKIAVEEEQARRNRLILAGVTVASVVVGGIAVRAVSRRVLAEVPAIGSTAA